MRYIFILAVFIFLAGVSTSWPGVKGPVKPDVNFFIAGPASIEDNEAIPNPFDNLELEAKAAAILDLSDDKIIFEKESGLEWPLASLTKLVTAVVSYDIGGNLLKEGAIIIPITSDAVLQEGDDGFLVGESYNAKDLEEAMLVRSSNDAAYALALWARENNGIYDESWFVNEMNMFVSRLGLHKTYFLNSTGLDVDDRLSGAYGTAEEVARLFSWLVKNRPDLITATSRPQITIYSVQGRKHVFDSSAMPIMRIPELIAVKSGYTDIAGGNLVLAYGVGPGHQFVAVILGSSYDGRFADALKLYEAVSEYVRSI
ncbi:MAG: hypothetical protein AAB527_00230 [Patescibacteria group bacterium]|mgnify:CR=1 FL=1